MSRQRMSALAVALVCAAGVSGCGGGDRSDSGAAAEARRGGTLRVASSSFEFTNNFDPTGEYLNIGWAYYSCCLIRTLMGYTHEPAPEGNELVPDLAAAEPELSNGRRTYTFTLRDGVRFSPPVGREITSRDVAYAFERIGMPSLVAQYGQYYDAIQGMAEFKAGKAKAISGIRTPDAKTISFTLTKPVGDFLYRLALPAAGPIPREVAKCFTKAGDYGRYVISSGPYMLKGSNRLDISSCDAMKPISGWDPTRHLLLARNPSYDPDTDP